jgi:acyl-CoA reductase-like NAD-dependent aldehyde dehydrogenase
MNATDLDSAVAVGNPSSRRTRDEEYATSDFRLLINGRLVEGAGTLDVINPATGRTLTTAPRGDRAQLDEAVAAAKAAFPTWSATPLRQRAALLVKLAEALESEQGQFARLLTQEQGKPLPQALDEIAYSIATLRYFTTLDLPPEVLHEDAARKVVRLHKPLGVVAAIMPWNVPMIHLAIKVAPALLAGNTVVAKPAPTTPLTTLRFGELCARILPPGVVNVIVDQNDLGAALTSYPDVAKVAFTGSTATGKKVMASAAGTLKRLTLELGGNDAAIVLDDADPKEVAPKIFAGAMFNAGQGCVTIKRLYVHDSIYDAICDELGRLARETVVGDGLEQGTQMGPIQNEAQFEKVKGYLEDGRHNGMIVAGGVKWSSGRASSSSRRSCATSPTTPGSSARSSSARCCRCCAIQTSTPRSHVPTTRNSAWAVRSGRRTAIVRSEWPPGSIPAPSGSTSISISCRILPSSARSSPASGPEWARRDLRSSPRRRSSTWRNKDSPGRFQL